MQQQTIDRRQFCKLSGVPNDTLQQEIRRGNLLLWETPLGSPPTRALKNYFVLDVALAVLADRIVRAGPTRRAMNLALPGLQCVLSNGVDNPNAFAAMAVGAEPGVLGIGCASRADLEAAGLFDPRTYVGVWVQSVAAIKDTIRARAERHGIALPENFAMPGLPPWARDQELAWRTKSGGVTVAWSPLSARPTLAELPVRGSA